MNTLACTLINFIAKLKEALTSSIDIKAQCGMSGRRRPYTSRKRKAAWKANVVRMQKAKTLKRGGLSAENPVDNSSPSTSAGDVLQGTPADDQEMDEAEESMINEPVDYKQWINSLQRETLQMLAMLLYDNYRERFGLVKTDAAKEVGLCLGVSDKTVRIWRKTFLTNSGHFLPDKRGKYPRNKPPTAVNNSPSNDTIH